MNDIAIETMAMSRDVARIKLGGFDWDYVDFYAFLNLFTAFILGGVETGNLHKCVQDSEEVLSKIKEKIGAW